MTVRITVLSIHLIPKICRKSVKSPSSINFEGGLTPPIVDCSYLTASESQSKATQKFDRICRALRKA